MAAPDWTLTQILDQLNSGRTWSGVQITYSFPTTSAFIYSGNGEGPGFLAFSGYQITIAELALTGWDDLISPDFIRETGTTNIELGYSTTGVAFAHAYYPGNGSAWFNANQNILFNPTLGKYGYETFVHEIGHALGLNHMGDYDASDPASVHPYSFQDSTVLSVMSYFGPSHFDGEGEVMWADWVKGGTSYSVQTPMVNDIIAIQAMYGAETTTRSGDTVYGFNSNITGSAANLYDFTVNNNPILSIYDSGGIDTIDLSGYLTSCRISLVAGSYSDCNEMTFNIGIAYTAKIENAIGGRSNDRLTGNGANNILTGDDGNDVIHGGDGEDIAVFTGNSANYTILSNDNGTYTVTDNVGNEGTDSLTSIELLRFRDRDVTPVGEDIVGTLDSDNLTGTFASERIFGLLGNDAIHAGAGDDQIRGGRAGDRLWGEAGADTFAFDHVHESRWKNGKFDVIMDFSRVDGDRIDLSMVDANSLKSGHQAFSFEGDGDGFAKRGRFDYWFENGDTHLAGYTDRDKRADFYMKIEDVVHLEESDFVLWMTADGPQ